MYCLHVKARLLMDSSPIWAGLLMYSSHVKARLIMDSSPIWAGLLMDCSPVNLWWRDYWWIAHISRLVYWRIAHLWWRDYWWIAQISRPVYWRIAHLMKLGHLMDCSPCQVLTPDGLLTLSSLDFWRIAHLVKSEKRMECSSLFQTVLMNCSPVKAGLLKDCSLF